MWAGAFGSVFRTDWCSPVVLCGVAPAWAAAVRVRAPRGGVVVQNASGLRPVRKGRRGGGPKCVSVWRFWPDPGDFGQTQTHFGPGARKDPGSARDSEAFWTTRPPGDRIVGTPTGCSARPPSHRAPGAAERPTARPIPPAGTLPGCACGSGKRTAPGGALQRGFPSGGASPGAPDPQYRKGPRPRRDGRGRGPWRVGASYAFTGTAESADTGAVASCQ